MNFRQPNEDLFENSRMSFGEHLEELRRVLVRALIGVAIASAIGFTFANQVIQTLKQPLVDAIHAYEMEETTNQLIDKYGFVPPEYVSWMETDQLIPRQIRVEPEQLVKAIKRVIPEFGTHVDLDPYAFRVEHFDQSHLPELATRLSKPDASDVQASKLSAIWELVPESDQAEIEEIATKSNATTADLISVVGIFNRLSTVEELNDAAAFQDVLTEGATGFWDWLFAPQTKPLASIKSRLEEQPDEALNRRLNRTLIVSLFPAQMPPLKLDLVPIEVWEDSEFEPQALGVGEGFSVWLKAGLFTGLVIAGPWIFVQIWSFVAAGLYPHEKKHMHVFLPISIALFVGGVLLAFYFVFQPVLGFLFSFNRSMGIAPQMRINDWLSFVMFLPLGFGIAFQLPLVMLFMNRIGLFTVEAYMSKWRIAVMVIFFLAMLLTPADPISMLLLAIPLTFLYFLGIGMCKWMPRSKNPFGEDVAAAS